MIIGSGLLARAFAANTLPTPHCVYAAGVSNSSCMDPREFEREKARLLDAITAAPDQCLFLYFSTCSIGDPEVTESAYVRHKLAMEKLVGQRQRYLILRLPQLAGSTPNPHTLLNHLYSRIVRSERFLVWGGARRNLIDVDDVVRITADLIASEDACNETINVANTGSYSIFDIISAFENALGHKAIFDILPRGTGYAIDTSRIQPALSRCGLAFDSNYLPRLIGKYYGHADDHSTA